MVVFSTFDGASCGQVALERAGIKVSRYYASEIDKHAIKVTQDNYPDTIQLGDVRDIKGSDLPKIDLIMGGSPCQGFSFAGKGLNFEDPRSKLFFEFVRLLKETKPKYWLLENVVMKQEHQNVISEYLGVQPVKINSALVSAQNRVRLYWANFPIDQPEDKGINLVDILEDLPEENKYKLNKATIVGRRLNGKGIREDNNKNLDIVQTLEVRKSETPNKSGCLTTVSKVTVLTELPIGRYPHVYFLGLPYRNYTKTERCRLMSLPDDYCKSVSLNQTVRITGNGWEVETLSHIFKNLPPC